MYKAGTPQASIRPLHYVSKRASHIYIFSSSFLLLKFWNNRMWIYSVPVHTGQLLCQAGKTGPYYFFSLSCCCRASAAPAISCAECLLSDRMRSRGHLVVKGVCWLVFVVTYRRTAQPNKSPCQYFYYSSLCIHYKLLRVNYFTDYAVVIMN